ncbi:hypothetical protein F0562_029932 [Nyssa sinensis]|uniref:Uncharacterized protein n=1 Tax=Nyssa sinensis TaxID=561372 RepID=A0A5J5AYM6_9ASTE|nr:hypothetical protein F0562_029932 [Nyssa sinensis]
MQQAHINIMKRGHIGFNRDSDGTKSSHHTRQLKESSTIHIQSKGTNSSLKNKFIAHEDRDTKEERKSPEILTGTSATETATISGRMFDEHSSGHKPYVLFTDQQDSGNISMGSRRQIHSKDSQDIDVRGASNDELKSVAYCEDENNYFQSSGAWIFPDEARRLCITTASKQVMDLMGSCSISVPENARKRHLQRGTDVELKRGEKTFHKPRKSRPESSADVASTGLVEQAIKIAIMVGFGALVLFTRQRKPRKSGTDGNNSFFTIPDYMDQQILTEEEMD